MSFAFSFLFMIASVAVMLAIGWCWLCFKVGCWLMRGMTRPFRRSDSMHAAAPRPAVIPLRVAPPPPPPQFVPDPRYQRGCSSRRRHGGGAAVVMTVLAIALLVCGVRAFFHSDSGQRGRARVAQAQRQLERRIQEAEARAARTERDLERRVRDAKQRAMAVLVKDTVSSVPEEVVRVVRKDPSWNVTGYGKTNEDAFQNALEKAYEQVSLYFHERIRGWQWPISAEFIRDRLVKDVQRESLLDEPSGETFRQVNLRLEITPEDQRLAFDTDRRYRMEHRMMWLGEILAAVLVVLGTGAAYVRLDEASKGYYTGWLRLAALALIGSAGASFWYFA